MALCHGMDELCSHSAAGNGLQPVSSPQMGFDDMGNCLSNVTIKISFFLGFEAVLKRIALQHWVPLIEQCPC